LQPGAGAVFFTAFVFARDEDGFLGKRLDRVLLAIALVLFYSAVLYVCWLI
jgi:hypothetical protein